MDFNSEKVKPWMLKQQAAMHRQHTNESLTDERGKASSEYWAYMSFWKVKSTIEVNPIYNHT